MAALPCGHRAGDKRPELPFDLLSRDLPRISLPVGQSPIQHQVQSCFPNIRSDTDIFLPIKWPRTLTSGGSQSPGYISWFPGPGWTPHTYWVPCVLESVLEPQVPVTCSCCFRDWRLFLQGINLGFFILILHSHPRMS